MGDLGLSSLNDDQLLELLIEACQELGQRDPIVRNLAQKQIYAEAERIKTYKAAIQDAVREARKNYEDSIRKESREWVDNLVKTGQWKPVNNDDELKIILDEDRRRREEVITQTRAALAQPQSAEQQLWLNITRTSVAASYTYRGQQRQTTQANKLDAAKVQHLIGELKRCLEI